MKNLTSIFLILISVVFFFFIVKGEIDKVKVKKAIFSEYTDAINRADDVEKMRIQKENDFSSFTETDRNILDEMVPDQIDSSHIAFVLNNMAGNLKMKSFNLLREEENILENTQTVSQTSSEAYKTNVVIAGFVGGEAEMFNLLKKIEKSRMLMDISSLEIKSGDKGSLDFNVSLKVYSLK